MADPRLRELADLASQAQRTTEAASSLRTRRNALAASLIREGYTEREVARTMGVSSTIVHRLR